MKTICSIFFSPTGNTKSIIDAFVSSQGNISVVSYDITKPETRRQFPTKIKTLKVEPDLWIIGSPVYYGRIPEIVLNTIKKIDGKNIPTIAIVTYGNKSYGVALKQLYNELSSLNFSLIGLGAFVGEHSYSDKFRVALNRPDLSDIKTANQFFEEKKEKLIPASDFSNIKGKIDFVTRIFPEGGPKPYLIKEKCNDCQVCINNCPKALIDDKTKSFRNKKSEMNCISCMSCVKSCPQKARDYKIPQPVNFFLDKIFFRKARKIRKEPILIV